MIIVVADASPVHYLVQIGAIDILPRLFDQVLIPQQVEQELLNEAAPQDVRHWLLTPPSWAVIRKPSTVIPLELDPGETEAIALAKEVQAFAVLLDDSLARKAAKKAGLQVMGTLGILEQAALCGVLDLASAIERLRRTNFHASPDLLQTLLDRDAARRR